MIFVSFVIWKNLNKGNHWYLTPNKHTMIFEPGMPGHRIWTISLCLESIESDRTIQRFHQVLEWNQKWIHLQTASTEVRSPLLKLNRNYSYKDSESLTHNFIPSSSFSVLSPTKKIQIDDFHSKSPESMPFRIDSIAVSKFPNSRSATKKKSLCYLPVNLVR